MRLYFAKSSSSDEMNYLITKCVESRVIADILLYTRSYMVKLRFKSCINVDFVLCGMLRFRLDLTTFYFYLSKLQVTCLSKSQK